MIVSVTEEIPDRGELIEIGHLRIKVLEVSNTKIELIEVLDSSDE